MKKMKKIEKKIEKMVEEEEKNAGTPRNNNEMFRNTKGKRKNIEADG